MKHIAWMLSALFSVAPMVYAETTPSNTVAPSGLDQVYLQLDAKYRHPNIVAVVVDQKGAPLYVFVRGKELPSFLSAPKNYAQAPRVPFVVIEQSQPHQHNTVYEALAVANDDSMLQVAASEHSKILKHNASLDSSYLALKTTANAHVIVPPTLTFAGERVVDVVNADGHSVLRRNSIPTVMGIQGRIALLNEELSGQRLAEAQQVYLSFERLVEKTPHLAVVKTTRMAMLRNMWKMPSLRDFVREQMDRQQYSPEERQAIKVLAPYA